MAQSKRTLTVVVAPEATAELGAIWRWNADHYSPDHADRYVGVLKQIIFGLVHSYRQGKLVGTRPDLRYILVRRRAKGHGHIVVYRLADTTVDVLHVFHTAQDWQSKLAGDRPPT